MNMGRIRNLLLADYASANAAGTEDASEIALINAPMHRVFFLFDIYSPCHYVCHGTMNAHNERMAFIRNSHRARILMADEARNALEVVR